MAHVRVRNKWVFARRPRDELGGQQDPESQLENGMYYKNRRPSRREQRVW